MNLDSAIELLSRCDRSELVDHAFGDAEVFWTYDGTEVAFGYFGGRDATVTVACISYRDAPAATTHIHFANDSARALRSCGTLRASERNDTTGPDVYTEGYTMPGLTLGGVFKELTGNTFQNKADQ